MFEEWCRLAGSRLASVLESPAHPVSALGANSPSSARGATTCPDCSELAPMPVGELELGLAGECGAGGRRSIAIG
jgi:hypothetical protein